MLSQAGTGPRQPRKNCPHCVKDLTLCCGRLRSEHVFLGIDGLEGALHRMRRFALLVVAPLLALPGCSAAIPSNVSTNGATLPSDSATSLLTIDSKNDSKSVSPITTGVAPSNTVLPPTLQEAVSQSVIVGFQRSTLILYASSDGHEGETCAGEHFVRPDKVEFTGAKRIACTNHDS